MADNTVHFYTGVSRIGEQTENVKHRDRHFHFIFCKFLSLSFDFSGFLSFTPSRKEIEAAMEG